MFFKEQGKIIVFQSCSGCYLEIFTLMDFSVDLSIKYTLDFTLMEQMIQGKKVTLMETLDSCLFKFFSLILTRKYCTLMSSTE